MLRTLNFPVSTSLRAYVNNVWVVVADEDVPDCMERMVPYGCMDLVFVVGPGLVYSGSNRKPEVLPRAFITGQITKPYALRYIKGTRVIGFGFYPHTAHVVCGDRSSLFTDDYVPIRDLVGVSLCDQVEEQLVGFEHLAEQVAYLQQVVQRLISDSEVADARVQRAEQVVRSILCSRGQVATSALSKQVGVSERHIQYLFQDYVGVTPSLFAKIIRFKQSLPLVQQGEVPLTDLVYRLGYYDQSHFIRDFKRFTRLTPTQYRSRNDGLLEAFVAGQGHSFLYNHLMKDVFILAD